MLDIFLKWAIPALCGAAVTLIANHFTRRSKRDKNVAEGVQCLLRLEIIRSYDHYSHKEYCPVYAREALSRGYKSYHNLGGNDVATDLIEKLMELPTDSVKI